MGARVSAPLRRSCCATYMYTMLRITQYQLCATVVHLNCGRHFTTLMAFRTRISHTRTVVRECCKDDDQCQWEMPKFDPPPHLNPLTDRHQNLPT